MCTECTCSLDLFIQHCVEIELSGLEREPLRYCKGDGKVTFIRSLLMLDKVTYEYVNVLERYGTGDISYKFTKPLWLFFQNYRSLTSNLMKCSVY